MSGNGVVSSDNGLSHRHSRESGNPRNPGNRVVSGVSGLSPRHSRESGNPEISGNRVVSGDNGLPHRHSRESGNPEIPGNSVVSGCNGLWIPAFAGMTNMRPDNGAVPNGSAPRIPPFAETTDAPMANAPAFVYHNPRIPTHPPPGNAAERIAG